MTAPSYPYEFVASDLAQFKLQAANWATFALQTQLPKLVLMEGAMGSGKTAWVTAIAEVFLAAEAASPSFTLHNEYVSTRAQLDHLDLDRLSTREEFESIGFWDLLEDRRLDGGSRFIFVEWADRLVELGVLGNQVPAQLNSQQQSQPQYQQLFPGFQVWRIRFDTRRPADASGRQSRAHRIRIEV